MSKVKRTRNQIKSKIEAIKKLNDNPKNINADSLYDKYLGDLPSSNQFLGKKLAGFADKSKRKKSNNNDIFSELIDIANQFLDSKKTGDKYDVNKATDNFYENFDKRRLRTHAITAASKTTTQLRNIVSNNVKKVFFAGDEGIESICGSDATLSVDSLTISPKEIDFLNILTVNPNTSVGKILYEPQTPNIGKQKTNRNLYNIFSGGVYSYTANNNNTLFDVSWNSGTQKFQISGLTQGSGSVRVDKFLGDYYSSLEFPEITGITKTAMQQLLSSDNGETYEFNVGTNQIERLCKKLFSICGTPTSRDSLKNQNAIDQFDENDEDLEAYFDFDDVEGIEITNYDISADVKVMNMAAAGGKIALANDTVAVTFSGIAGSNQVFSNNVIDFVGFSSTANAYEGSNRAPVTSKSTAIRRKSNMIDTDQNGSDFESFTPSTPKYSGTSLATYITDAETFSSTFISTTNDKNGDCTTDGLSWTSLTNTYNALSYEAKVEFTNNTSNATIVSARDRYQYLRSFNNLLTNFANI